jgi:hypothetical protein
MRSVLPTRKIANYLTMLSDQRCGSTHWLAALPSCANTRPLGRVYIFTPRNGVATENRSSQDEGAGHDNRCNGNSTVRNRARLFVLLISLLLSFFLGSALGLLLLFPFTFVFTSFVAHVYLSVIGNESSSPLCQTGLTFSALGPFGPRPSVYDTRCPSWSSS